MDSSDQASVQDQASKPRRRMRTSEEKRRIVREAMAPGASVAAIARKHAVNANLLFGWCRLYQRGLLDQCREPATLLPVKVGLPAKQQAPKPPTRTAGKDHIEIEFPGGISVRVYGRMEPEAFEAVLRALRSR